MDAQVAVGDAEKLLELIEGERGVNGQGADDCEARAFVNQAIEIGAAAVAGPTAAVPCFDLSSRAARKAPDLAAIFPRNDPTEDQVQAAETSGKKRVAPVRRTKKRDGAQYHEAKPHERHDAN